MRRRGPTLAIVNPAAGRGAGRRLLGRLAADLARDGIEAEVVRTPGPGEAARLAAAAVEDGYARVIAVGGDGTANEVANGLVGSDVVLGLYPIGSGNDFSRALGYPRGRKRVGKFLASARVRQIDVGEANGRVFLNAAGVGIDGHVAERVLASARVVGQTLGYLVGSLVSIATFRPRVMRIRLDDAEIEGRHLIVVAANGTHFGSGMHVAPSAKLDDGMFDVVVGGDLGRWASIVALAKLYRGTHVNGRTILAFRSRMLDIDFDEAQPMEADGEPARVSALHVVNRPRSLWVLAK